MERSRILVVEDEPDIRHEVERALLQEGYQVGVAADGDAALALAAAKTPDLAILDILMPGLNGLEVCRRLREDNPAVRILFLTALGGEVDKVRGLDAGADDYLAKPFSMPELKARIRALLRRREPLGRGGAVRFADVRVVPKNREVTKAGAPVALTAKEFDLLWYLVQRPGEALSREDLLQEIWGLSDYYSTRTVDVHILRLRKKLEPDPENARHLLTVRGVGYKFLPGARAETNSPAHSPRLLP